MSRWKGYGVYVYRLDGGCLHIGTLPEEASDRKVSALIAVFEQFGAPLQYLSRWIDGESRLDIVVGSGAAQIPA